MSMARTDTERLDWLTKQHALHEWRRAAPHHGEFCPVCNSFDLRAAIDAEMDAEEPTDG